MILKGVTKDAYDWLAVENSFWKFLANHSYDVTKLSVANFIFL